MLWNDEVTLITRALGEVDELGQQLFEVLESTVLCNEKSVGRYEFYQAAQSGYKPSIILEIHSFESNNPFEVLFKNNRYSVIKEYTKGDITELTCEYKVNSI